MNLIYKLCATVFRYTVGKIVVLGMLFLSFYLLFASADDEINLSLSETHYLALVKEELSFRQYASETFRYAMTLEHSDRLLKHAYGLLNELEKIHETEMRPYRQSLGIHSEISWLNKGRSYPTAEALRLFPIATLKAIHRAAEQYIPVLENIVAFGPDQYHEQHKRMVRQEKILLQFLSYYIDGQKQKSIDLLQQALLVGL